MGERGESFQSPDLNLTTLQAITSSATTTCHDESNQALCVMENGSPISALSYDCSAAAAVEGAPM